MIKLCVFVLLFTCLASSLPAQELSTAERAQMEGAIQDVPATTHLP